MVTEVNVSTDKRAFTVAEFCKAFGIGRSTLYVELKSGRLRARKAGGRTLILSVDAEAWVKSLPEARNALHG